MRPVRILLAVVVLVGVIGLSRSWAGGPALEDTALDDVAVPAAVDPDAASSTWYCTVGAAPTEGPSTHLVLMSSPTGGEGTAVVTAYGTDAAMPPAQIEIPGSDLVVVDAAAAFGTADVSIMVESSVPDLVVEHRVAAAEGATQVPCSTSGSDSWFFLSQSTVLGATAQLVLFNPFPKDASVDVVATLDSEVIAAPGLTGIVVPAGTRRVLDLGEHVQRRPQFSMTVRLRTGRVIAETIQWLDISAEDAAPRRGLRLQLGVQEPRSDWYFAGGFTGEGAQETLVVHNPGDDPVSALVQVAPYGAGDLLPEPFEIVVQPRRTSVLDLTAESRVPPVGLHSISVRAADGDQLVVGRVNDVTGATEQRSTPEMAQRPPLDRGTTIGTGSPGAARRWAATAVPATAELPGMILVHNPTNGIAVVTARLVGGELDGIALAEGLEVAPGDSVAIRSGEQPPASGVLNVVVDSDEPVVVESLLSFAAENDLSMGLAVPLLDNTGGFAPVPRR